MPSVSARLVPLTSGEAEAIAFLERVRQEPGVSEAGQQSVSALEDELRMGSVAGSLWLGPSDEAAALVYERRSNLGCRVRILPGADYRTPPALAALLSDLEAAEQLHPLLSIRLLEPTPEPGKYARVMEAAGYYYLERIDLHFPAQAPLPATEGRELPPVRPVERADSPGLGRLMDRAYTTDPYDRMLFQEDPDSAKDARASIEAILGGRYGAWIASASFLAGDGREPAGAVLCVENDGGLIAELMVDPRLQRRGIGRHLLGEALGELRAGGHRPRLVYTKPNRPAETLYLSLGFRPPVPPYVGGEWVHLSRLGQSALTHQLRYRTEAAPSAHLRSGNP
jgi:ribosomal protein S18 acetylase RimI-like enzyme